MKSNQTGHEARLRIADIRIRVFSADPGMNIELGAEMEPFCVHDAGADLTLEASWRSFPGGCGGRRVFDSGGAWQLYRADDAYWFQCKAPAFGEMPYKTACLSRDFTSGQVFLHRPFFKDMRTVNPLQYPLDELLLLKLLSQGRGVEVHACGIVDVNGDGYLFTGHSGAGKTTMAKLWEAEAGVRILSDDRVILRQEKDRIWIYGTPWHGEAELSSASRAPLKQICFIRHGRKNSLKPVTGADAAARLFSRSFPVFYSPEGLEFTIDFYGRVAGMVPCYELGVIPSREIVDFVRENLR
jgi:hypothetical protein